MIIERVRNATGNQFPKQKGWAEDKIPACLYVQVAISHITYVL